MLSLTIAPESWPIAGAFTISRGSKTTAEVVVVTLDQDGHRGRGECVPYPRYGETVEGVVASLEAARTRIEAGFSHADILEMLKPRAARNALDCALWDLEAKQAGKPAWQMALLQQPRPMTTAYTLSLDTPEAMAKAAGEVKDRPLLKLKMGGENDAERLRLIRAAAPTSRLIIDANEGWTPDTLPQLLKICAEVGVELIEQPLPAVHDEMLRGFKHEVPICADESAHDRQNLHELLGKYDAINIKLDKAGGLTEALALASAAKELNFKIMVGCMVATSLAMAPSMLVAQLAQVIDLDGPLLLARDRKPGIDYDGSLMYPPPPELWG
jgi:L-alanine-DL-glutamate epimerase-like enolase superfamily enzyme